MKYIIITLHLFSISFYSHAQQNRTINEPDFGVQFTVPEGWNYQQSEMGYIMGHNTIPGIIILMGNDFKSIEEVENAASQGLQEDNGTFLQLKGELKPFGQNGRAGNFSGTLEGQQVNAYMISLVSTTNGKGVTMMAAATPDLFNQVQVQAIESLGRSVRFTKIETPSIVEEWRNSLKVQGGCRLTYMNTYSSTDYGGGGGGYSDKTVIDLCPQGYFRYSDNSDMSFDTQGGFGYSNSESQGNGTWELATDGTNAVLRLIFNDGRVFEYTLTYENEKTQLNGTHYFRTYSNSSTGVPQCN